MFRVCDGSVLVCAVVKRAGRWGHTPWSCSRGWSGWCRTETGCRPERNRPPAPWEQLAGREDDRSNVRNTVWNTNQSTKYSENQTHSLILTRRVTMITSVMKRPYQETAKSSFQAVKQAAAISQLRTTCGSEQIRPIRTCSLIIITRFYFMLPVRFKQQAVLQLRQIVHFLCTVGTKRNWGKDWRKYV